MVRYERKGKMKINVKFIAIIIFICIIIVWGIPTFFLNKISGKYSVKDKIIYNSTLENAYAKILLSGK